tara:strand:+ start:482 stop:2125 length:1644 start_codon:yes stop_codon:yes gene_type:complete
MQPTSQKRKRDQTLFQDLICSPDNWASLAARAFYDISRIFDDDLSPRIWPNNGDLRRLEFLKMKIPEIEDLLINRGPFKALIGTSSSNKQDVETLRRLGLSVLAKGGFNSVWSGKMTEASRKMLPVELVENVSNNLLVMRGPLEKTESVDKAIVVGEVRNVLHAALCGYGPRVAAMVWIRTMHPTLEEGVSDVRYRLLSFTERGDGSVDSRLQKLQTQLGGCHYLAVQRQQTLYFDALARCIFEYSRERFVHLDCTLRNFVDFIPEPGFLPKIKIIDIDDSVFRCLRAPDAASTTGTGWRFLWLHNTLLVSCFLKQKLWSIEEAQCPVVRPSEKKIDVFSTWWNPLRRAINETLSTFRKPWNGISVNIDCKLANEFLRACTWISDEPYCSLARFPDVSDRRHGGNSPEAVALSALAFAFYYFVVAPLEEIERMYVEPVVCWHQVRNRANATHQERSDAERGKGKAVAWYDGTCRHRVLPSVYFFYTAMRHSVPGTLRSAPLVEIMAEFVAIDKSTLQTRALSHFRPASHHTLTTLGNFTAYLTEACG